MEDLKENNVWLIPYSDWNVRLWDRIVHIFTVNNKNYYIFMWYLYWIQPRISGEKALYLSKQQDLILPSFWNLHIDHRPRYKRILDSLSELIK